MQALLRGIIVATLLSCAACATTVMVDDSDPRIEYIGLWVRNPISDPENLNYGGTLTGTNTTGAGVLFSFQGATQIAAYGAFPLTGTFSLASTYGVDGFNITSFLPKGTITHPQFRQQFYVSEQLTTEPHQFGIINVGEEFYIDYILLTMDDDSATASSPSLSPTRQSIVQTPSSTSASASLSAAGQGIQTRETPARTSGEPHRSPASVLPGASTTMSSSAVHGSPTTNTQSSSRDRSTLTKPGTIAGVAVGIAVLVMLAAVAGCHWRRRRRAKGYPAIVPFALASSATRQHDEARSWDAAYERTTVFKSTEQSASPVHAWEDDGMSSIHYGATIHVPSVPDRDPEGELPHDRPASPAQGSPLFFRGSGDGVYNSSLRFPAPSSPAAKGRRTGEVQTGPRRSRQSTDGGVRLAGGPPGIGLGDADVDSLSMGSTVPPAYQLHSL